MNEIDLMSIGSYTELPGGNIALPQGYSSILAPIIKVKLIKMMCMYVMTIFFRIFPLIIF